MANLLRNSGRVVDTTLTASVGVVTNLAEVLNTGSGIITAQLSSIAEDVKRSNEANKSETVKKYRDQAAILEAENDALMADTTTAPQTANEEEAAKLKRAQEKAKVHPHPPLGNLLLRTMTLPRDANPAGDIFGGWIMSQLDIAGAVLAREISHGRVVTVAVDAMSFLKPVEVGDVVCCYGHCIRVGRTSLKIKLELWVKKIYEHEETERDLVTEACFTYVAVDDNGRPRPLPPEAHIVAERGIDAGTVGLKEDGTIREAQNKPNENSCC